VFRKLYVTLYSCIKQHPAGDNSCTPEMFKPTDDQPYTTKCYITTKG